MMSTATVFTDEVCSKCQNTGDFHCLRCKAPICANHAWQGEIRISHTFSGHIYGPGSVTMKRAVCEDCVREMLFEKW